MTPTPPSLLSWGASQNGAAKSMTSPERECEKKARSEAKRLEARKDAHRKIKSLEAEIERLRAIIAKQLY